MINSFADLSQSGPLLTADAASTGARSHCGARLYIMSRNENIPPPVLFYFTVIFYLTLPTFCWNRFNLSWVNPKFWLETNDSSPPHTHKQPSPPHHPVYCFSYPSLKKLNAGVHGRTVEGGNGRGKWCNCIVISKNKGKNLKIRILAYWNIQAKRLLKKTCSNLWVYIVR